MEDSKNIKEVLGILRSKMKLIAIFALVAVMVSGIVSFFLLTPLYESSTQMLVNQNRSGVAQYDNQNIQTDLQLIDTYSVIIESPVILDRVIERLDLEETAGQLNERITVSSAENSQVVNITVRYSDPAVAVSIANATTEVFQEEIQGLMNVNNVSILSPAMLAAEPVPVEPSPLLNMVIAALIGVMLGVGFAFLSASMDTTIKNEDDLEGLLGVPVLGLISPAPPEIKAEESSPLPLKRKEV